jgi:L-methionine (R)-S-oxide reductase
METITVVAESKKEKYEELFPQLVSLLAGEDDIVASLANISAALGATFPHFLWVGFYLLKGEELVLGPFQGKVACIRIKLGSGVCGTAATKRRTVIVPDVAKFPGHIVCDPESRSEIVVPLLGEEALFGVLDVDSGEVDAFDQIDQENLERIASKIIVPRFVHHVQQGK